MVNRSLSYRFRRPSAPPAKHQGRQVTRLTPGSSEAPAPAPGIRRLARPSPTEPIIAAAILLLLALQAHLATVMEINWDEFHFLSLIYDYQRGELEPSLQTFHVHLFGWATSIDLQEVQKIEILRLVMLAFETGAIACIYLLSRAFLSRPAALLSALSFVSAGFVMVHGASFRADPVATLLMIAAITILARSSLRSLLLAAVSVLIGLAGMVTIKTALYLPAIAAVAGWRLHRAPSSAQTTGRLAACAVGAAATFWALYALHQTALPQSDVAGSAIMAASAAQTALLDQQFFPRWSTFVQGLSWAYPSAILIVVGAAIASASLVKNIIARVDSRRVQGSRCQPATGPDSVADAILMLALGSPLLSLLFYRNAFPYFFPFIFPPAMVLAGLAVDRLGLSRLGQLAIAASMVAGAGVVYARAATHDQQTQMEIATTVHKMFPQPVAMIDGHSMISSFPNRSFFMSTWGMESYHRRSKPIFADLLDDDTVPLLVLNAPGLEHAVAGSRQLVPHLRLLDADRAILRQNYIPHWGKIWVAGQVHRVGADPIRVEISVPGVYTVEAGGPVIIDGRVVPDGSLVRLLRGTHHLSAPAPDTVTLRWGERLFRPRSLPSYKPVYRGFVL